MKYKIAILTICTGKYTMFFDKFYNSCESYFLKNCDKTYFVFTDGQIATHKSVNIVNQKKLGWPYDTMMRFQMFNSIQEKLRNFDYIYFFNANMLFLEDVDSEVLPFENHSFLMGVEHPGFYGYPKITLPYERRFESNFYVPYDCGSKYFQGCFNGGRSSEFLEMSSVLESKINEDLSNGIIPIWHDESALNWYFHDKSPLILSPSYAYPESYDIEFEKKIIQLDKSKLGGHEFLRN